MLMSRRMTVNSALSSPTPSMEGNLWPAVPNQHSAIMLSLLFQLEQSQWWDPERLQAAQFRQAAEVLRHTRRTTPYYAELLSDIGWRYGQPLTADIWSELPLLRREDIQDAGERLHSRALPKGHGKTGAISTSGSTGKPVRVLTTDLTTAMWVAFTLRDYIWRRCDFSAKFAAIRSVTTITTPQVIPMANKRGPGAGLMAARCLRARGPCSVSRHQWRTRWNG